MKQTYNGVEVPRDGTAIEYDAPASQEKTPPFAKGAQDGAPAKTFRRVSRAGAADYPVH